MSEQQTFRITGMDCADCAKSIERGVGKLDGVTACAINFGAATLRVEGGAGRDAVIQRVRELGYGVRIGNEQLKMEKQGIATRFLNSQFSILKFLGYLLSRRDTALAVLGAVLILPGLLFNELLPFLGIESMIFDLTSVAALLVAGYPVARSAWRSLAINRSININVLMTIAAAGAVVIGAYTEAGLVMVLFAIGEALEGYTMEQARDSIRSLMTIAPDEATALRLCVDCQEHLGQDGYAGGPCPLCGLEETRVFVDELRVGDVIVAKPGERIAMDGRVRAGASSVNQAPITGESVPVTKTVGDGVFAGTVNGEGALEIEVTHLVEDNTLSRIIHMVEEAQAQKAPAEKFVDQFAGIYTPAVVALAALIAVVPPALFGAPFWGAQGWLYRALELLVVACPCALVISTPVVLVSAISNAARNGVLIKGGAYLELLSQVKAIAFDKTGTLTEGRPRVIEVKSVACQSEGAKAKANCPNCEDMLALASAVERRSEHPLAKAVITAAEHDHVSARYPAAEDVKAIMGKGVVGRVNGRDVLIGSHAYFDQVVPHDRAHRDVVEAAAAQGRTALLVGADDAYLGYITVADAVRESSKQAIAELKRAGVTSLVMLTGDNAATAATIAAEVGVTEVKANLLPEHKVDAVKALLAEHGVVAMVGDGINDAPALATASLGIAMGAGTAQALETADIALMGNDLGKLPFAIRLSRTAMRTIKANIAFAVGVKLAFLALVLMGLGTMWLAVLADVGAALVVTLFGMRLLKWTPKKA